MAKSVRSKSRRKNARAKREIYNTKELEQLKKTIGLTKEAERIRREEILQDLRDLAEGIKKCGGTVDSDVPMEASATNGKADQRTKDSRAKNGNPVWKSQRKIKAAKKAAVKAKKVNKNKNKNKTKKITKSKVGKKEKA